MKRYDITNLIYIYMCMRNSNGLLNFKNQTFGQGERGKPGVGFNLTSDGNYDIVNIKTGKCC